jgi:hypothetical protein
MIEATDVMFGQYQSNELNSTIYNKIDVLKSIKNITYFGYFKLGDDEVDEN